MNKILCKPTTSLFPLPVCLVSCGKNEDNYNVLTIAWTGTINSDPPMTYISVRQERHSYNIIKDTSEFVINLTTEALTFATDFCGVRSGADTNKFKEANLTPVTATKVSAPLIKECPVNIECKVKQIIPLGSHDMFLADVLAVNVTEEFVSPKGKINYIESNPICYLNGSYYSLGNLLGSFGYSLSKMNITN